VRCKEGALSQLHLSTPTLILLALSHNSSISSRVESWGSFSFLAQPFFHLKEPAGKTPVGLSQGLFGGDALKRAQLTRVKKRSPSSSSAARREGDFSAFFNSLSSSSTFSHTAPGPASQSRPGGPLRHPPGSFPGRNGKGMPSKRDFRLAYFPSNSLTEPQTFKTSPHSGFGRGRWGEGKT